MVGLSELRGLWRRTLIAWPDGRADTETEVFWLQGPRRYADLRVPAGRPAYSHITCLRDLDRPMLRFMARQEGFFGHLDVVDNVGHWHRDFDYQPATGVADCGALAFEDGILVERGIDLPYVEHWSREAVADDVVTLALVSEEGTPGCLVAAGEAFVYARGRVAPLPQGATLDRLIDDTASPQIAQELFDCEISFGRWRNGDWRIARSSLCFREGAALSPRLDEGAGILAVGDVTPEGSRIERIWRIAEYECASAAPVSRWFGSRGGRDIPPKMTVEMLGALP